MWFFDGDRVEAQFVNGSIVRGVLTLVDGVGLVIEIAPAVRVVVFPTMVDGPHRDAAQHPDVVSVRPLCHAETFQPGDRVVRPNGLTGTVTGVDVARVWVAMDAYDVPTSFQPHALEHDFR